jgi:transposase
MRGDDRQQHELFSYGGLDERIAADHPLRRIRALADQALARLTTRFDAIYGDAGRPSIAPEKLLRAMLLQVLYSVRSERALMDQMDLHLGFRWFVGLSLSDAVWDASTFSKNRERFTVDGTLMEAWASMRSYRPKDDPPAPGQGSGRRGELQKRDLFHSTTDPEAHLYRKSQREVATLRYLGHVLCDREQGLIAAACVTSATTKAEREAAVELIENLDVRRRRIQVAADKGYDEAVFVERLRGLGATPQVTQYRGQRRSSIDRRTTRHATYDAAQRARKRIEPIFSWLKLVGGQRRTRFRGRDRVGWAFTFAAATYNLMRMARLSLISAPA